MKNENEELLKQLDNFDGQMIEMQSMASSAGTEMVLASDGTMSAGGYSTQSMQLKSKNLFSFAHNKITFFLSLLPQVNKNSLSQFFLDYRT